MTHVLQMADKLEALTGPSWQIDQEIYAVLNGWSFPLHGAAMVEFDQASLETGLTSPTRSVDAAMALLPPLDETLRPLSIIMGVSEDGKRFQVVLKNWRWGAVKSSDRCCSYPVALAAAALRARASSLPNEDGK